MLKASAKRNLPGSDALRGNGDKMNFRHSLKITVSKGQIITLEKDKDIMICTVVKM
ncbi:MAG: hypothetical protein GY795_34005 [Desulfobacterales bacterium]|nr:hypothetical protein [Desulfobacterales bacterium]